MCLAITPPAAQCLHRLHNLVDKICHEGMLSPFMEKKNILGPVDGRRPGDVTIPLWRANNGLAIDVAVTSPFGSHNLSLSEPNESYAHSKKHNNYDKSFKGTCYEFVPLIFETTGGVQEEGLQLLRQLFRFAAKHQSQQLSVYCGRAWARLSCSLQFSVSQCFLNRTGSVAAIEKDIDFCV